MAHTAASSTLVSPLGCMLPWEWDGRDCFYFPLLGYHAVFAEDFFKYFFLSKCHTFPSWILMRNSCNFDSVMTMSVKAGVSCVNRPRGDVTVYVWHKPTELAHSFLFCSCVYFCLYGPFNCISFHKFSWQLSVFSHCTSSLISALLVLSTLCLFMKVSFSPDVIPSDWLG